LPRARAETVTGTGMAAMAMEAVRATVAETAGATQETAIAVARETLMADAAVGTETLAATEMEVVTATVVPAEPVVATQQVGATGILMAADVAAGTETTVEMGAAAGGMPAIRAMLASVGTAATAEMATAMAAAKAIPTLEVSAA